MWAAEAAFSRSGSWREAEDEREALRWAALQRLHDAPAMSRTATGQWVSAHMVSTAADEHGLVTQLQAARQEFPTYIEAIKLAKKNYQSREEDTRAKLAAIPPADHS